MSSLIRSERFPLLVERALAPADLAGRRVGAGGHVGGVGHRVRAAAGLGRLQRSLRVVHRVPGPLPYGGELARRRQRVGDQVVVACPVRGGSRVVVVVPRRLVIAEVEHQPADQLRQVAVGGQRLAGDDLRHVPGQRRHGRAQRHRRLQRDPRPDRAAEPAQPGDDLPCVVHDRHVGLAPPCPGRPGDARDLEHGRGGHDGERAARLEQQRPAPQPPGGLVGLGTGWSRSAGLGLPDHLQGGPQRR